MALTYRTDGAWGTGKGSNLTPEEVDENFHTLDQLIGTLTDALLPVGIADIALVGNQLTFTLEDATEFGPFTTPTTAMRWRGVWNESETYVRNDVVAVGPAIYLVLQNHVSVFPFFAERLIGGSPVYATMLGSSIGGGVFGFSKVGTSVETEYTCQLADNGAYLRFSSSVDFEIPDDSTLDLPVGYTVTVRKVNDVGLIFFFTESAATLNVPTGFISEITADGAVVTLIKVGPDEWDIFGDLDPEP